MLSSSYDVLKVVGSEPEVKKARMALYEAARQVLHNGMRVLGLSPVDRYVYILSYFGLGGVNANCVLGCELA